MPDLLRFPSESQIENHLSHQGLLADRRYDSSGLRQRVAQAAGRQFGGQELRNPQGIVTGLTIIEANIRGGLDNLQRFPLDDRRWLIIKSSLLDELIACAEEHMGVLNEYDVPDSL